MKLKIFIYTLLACILTVPVLGQNGIDEARAFLARVQDTYHKAAYLGFKIKYRYSNEGSADKTLDSLGGTIQMDKSRCRLLVDGTETVMTGRYIIQVMPEEQAIFLSGASASSAAVNPVQMLDSAFAHLEGVHCQVTSEGGSSTLKMDFPAGRQYSWIKMEADANTGLFRRISYGLQVKGLVSEDMIDRPGHPGQYQQRGQLDMIFTDYENGRFGDAVFDENNYITRIAQGKFEPAGQFRDYHIYLNNSNL